MTRRARHTTIIFARRETLVLFRDPDVEAVLVASTVLALAFVGGDEEEERLDK